MGIDTERFVSKVNDDLMCMICLEVLEDPHECLKCQTSFCHTCITDWSSKKNTCPNHCELVLQRSHKFLRSELNKLQLKCINSNEGCDQISSLESMAQHESLCQFTKIKCINADCPVNLQRSQIESHLKECQYREILCERCKASYYFNKADEHKCVRAIAKKFKELDLKVHKFIDECYFYNHLFNDSVNIHFGTKCGSCGMNPIEGQRFFCKICEDFSQCWKCNSDKKHEHKEFVEFHRSGVHENILCDDCGMYPIGDLRYKCRECNNFGKEYLDLCHSCRLKTKHPHTEFICWKPVIITVKELPYKKMTYKRGEEFIRSWSIFNESDEDFTGFSIVCINGDCCSKAYLANSPYYNFSDVVVRAKQQREIFVRDIVSQNKPGYYKSQWGFEIPQRVGLFGPFLFYEIYVI